MSTQHTQGRLTACTPSDTLHAIRNARNCIVADVGYSGTTTVDIANARRLVACWNACDGIDTDNLEAHSVNIIHKLHDDAAKRVLSERDELLEALKECIEDSEQAVCEYIEKYGETYRPQRLQAMRNTVAKARAAIAKAGGGA